MKRTTPIGGWQFVGIRVPASLWKAAQARARRSGEPVRALVQRSIEAELRRKPREVRP